MNSVRASLASQTSVVPVVTRRSLNKSNVSQTSVVPVVPVVIGQSLNSNVNQSRVVVAVRTNAQREWPVEEILVELNGSTNLLQEVVETWQKSKECRNPNQCERIMEELYEKAAESAAPNGTGLAKPKCWQVLIWGIRYRQILEELNTEEKKLYSRHFQADATTSGIPLIVYQHTTIFPALFTMNCALENEVHRIFSYIASKSELWLVSNLNHLNIALEQVLKQKQVQSQEQKRTLRPGAIRLPFYQINLGGKPDLALIKRFDHRNPQVLQRSMCVRCGYPFSGKNELACVRCNLHKTTSLSQKSDELKKSLGNLNTTLLEFIQKDGFVYCCHVPASTGKNVVSDRNDFLALSIDQVRKTYRNDWKGFKERLEKLGKPFKSNEIYVFLVYVNLMRTSAKDLYSSCSPLVQRGLTKLEFFLVHAHIGGILVSIRNQMPNAIANFAHFEQQWFKGNPNEAEACAQIEKDLKSFSKWWKISTRVDSEVSKLLDTLLTQSFDLPFVKQDFAFIYHLLKDEFNSVNIDRVSRQGNDQTKAVDSPFKMQCAPISECEFLKKNALVKQIQDKNYTEDSCRCFPWMITEKKQARKGNQKTESATASATAFADLGAEVGAIASATASADVDVGAIASATARFDFNFDEEPTVLAANATASAVGNSLHDSNKQDEMNSASLTSLGKKRKYLESEAPEVNEYKNDLADIKSDLGVAFKQLRLLRDALPAPLNLITDGFDLQSLIMFQNGKYVNPVVCEQKEMDADQLQRFQRKYFQLLKEDNIVSYQVRDEVYSKIMDLNNDPAIRPVTILEVNVAGCQCLAITLTALTRVVLRAIQNAIDCADATDLCFIIKSKEEFLQSMEAEYDSPLSFELQSRQAIAVTNEDERMESKYSPQVESRNETQASVSHSNPYIRGYHCNHCNYEWEQAMFIAHRNPACPLLQASGKKVLNLYDGTQHPTYCRDPTHAATGCTRVDADKRVCLHCNLSITTTAYFTHQKRGCIGPNGNSAFAGQPGKKLSICNSLDHTECVSLCL